MHVADRKICITAQLSQTNVSSSLKNCIQYCNVWCVHLHTWIIFPHAEIIMHTNKRDILMDKRNTFQKSPIHVYSQIRLGQQLVFWKWKILDYIFLNVCHKYINKKSLIIFKENQISETVQAPKKTDCFLHVWACRLTFVLKE